MSFLEMSSIYVLIALNCFSELDLLLDTWILVSSTKDCVKLQFALISLSSFRSESSSSAATVATLSLFELYVS